MPFKPNAAHRHRIPKQKLRVTNWADYEAGLRQRGSLTFWLSAEALSAWHAPKRNTAGGQPRYSDLAVETSLMLGLVFDLPLRQIEGFVSSLFGLMGVHLPIPDHTTLSRRSSQLAIHRTWRGERNSGNGKPLHVVVDSTGLKIYGAGQWLEDKHGVKSRRQWRKLHLAMDADSGEILAEVLTDQNTSDVSQLEPLLDTIDTPIGCFMADGAYDGQSAYGTIQRHSAGARIIIPPRSHAIPKALHRPPTQREDHVISIANQGRMAWQASTGYGRRSLVETAMSRYKSIIGNRLRARKLANQKAEAARACTVLNRMLSCARPKSVRVKDMTA